MCYACVSECVCVLCVVCVCACMCVCVCVVCGMSCVLCVCVCGMWYVVSVVCGMEGGEKYTQVVAVAVSLLTITVGGNTGSNMEC